LLKRLALAVLALVAVALVFVATRPDHFRIERSARVSAAPDVVFALIDDFHQWGRWSPWEKIDPDMRRTFAGPAAGRGSSYAWAGNHEIGSGRMTILESRPGELVSIELEFMEPFAATNLARFELAPSGDGTRVRWSMEGENNFLGKAISLVMDMDAMVGERFEQGLADLDSAAQAEARERRRQAQDASAGASVAEAARPEAP
jgi:hypothetical protein